MLYDGYGSIYYRRQGWFGLALAWVLCSPVLRFSVVWYGGCSFGVEGGRFVLVVFVDPNWETHVMAMALVTGIRLYGHDMWYEYRLLWVALDEEMMMQLTIMMLNIQAITMRIVTGMELTIKVTS